MFKKTIITTIFTSILCSNLMAKSDGEIDFSKNKVDLKAPVALNHKLTPKVLVINLFEVGEYTGDTPGEAQLWIEGEKLTTTYKIPGLNHPLFYNPKTKVASIITDMGKVNSANSTALLGAYKNIDLSNTFIIISGIAGVNPKYGSIGSVFFSDYSVDTDLKHEVDPREITDGNNYQIKRGCKDAKSGWCDKDASDGTEVVKFNKKLLEKAYNLTKNTKLLDSTMMKNYRANYPQKLAKKAPFVGVGSNSTADTYYHGTMYADEVSFFVDKWTKGKGHYTTTAMEDTAVMAALSRLEKFGKVNTNKVISIRSASNYDRQGDNQTALESLRAHSGGFIPSLINEYRVGHILLKNILNHTSDWEKLVK